MISPCLMFSELTILSKFEVICEQRNIITFCTQWFFLCDFSRIQTWYYER